MLPKIVDDITLKLELLVQPCLSTLAQNALANSCCCVIVFCTCIALMCSVPTFENF